MFRCWLSCKVPLGVFVCERRKLRAVSVVSNLTFSCQAGVGLGLESTAMPVMVISVAIISAYWLGKTSGLQDSHGLQTGGLFGTAVATMGMLSTAGYVLTMDMFGPIADNAGGIVEMSQQVRVHFCGWAEMLDSLFVT